MPVASCDGESLLGSVEVRTWKGTEPMSVCDSGSGGQGCKHSVPRAVRAGDAGMSRAGFDFKSLELQEEIHRILEGPFRMSRAGFGRELLRIERKIGSIVRQAVAQYGP